MNTDNEKEKKEDENMAMIIKPNEATIIKKDMLSSFLAELCANEVTKEYWNECRSSRTLFSSSDMEKMKKMCDGVKS